MTAPLPCRVAWFAPWTWKRRWKTAWALLAVFVVYPLSIGPATAMVIAGWIPGSVYSGIYLPIMLLEQSLQSKELSTLIYWYVNLFVNG